LWSKTFDRPMSDVFKIQDEIAQAVVAELKVKLLGTMRPSHSTDPTAYALYLQAKEITWQFTPDALAHSIELYKQALAIDPSYAAAWVGLANSYRSQALVGARAEHISLARSAIARALVVDQNFAPAHAALGAIALNSQEPLSVAAGHIKRALTLEPSNTEALSVAVTLLRRLGRLEQAIAVGKFVVDRNPLDVDARFELGLSYWYAGHLNKALTELRTALRLYPDAMYGHAPIGEVLLQQGDVQGALTEMRQEPHEAFRLGGLSMAYSTLGREAESEAAFAEMAAKHGEAMAFYIAAVAAYRGDNDIAFEWLNRAEREDDPSLSALAVHPAFHRLRQDPRWPPFLRKLGLAPDQLAAVEYITGP
jgi:tetratricopeptide (TPR) repeat protein